MTAWADLSPRLDSLLGVSTTASPEDKLVWFNQALVYFADTHTAKQRTESFTADGVATDFVLGMAGSPAALLYEVLDIGGVYSEDTGSFLEPIEIRSGMAWQEGEDSNGRPQGYMHWPHGTIHSLFVPSDGSLIKVWYYTYWPAIEGDNDVVEAPTWAHEALLTYASACSLVAQIGDATVLNEYKTRVDSGTPIHNPFIGALDALMKRYQSLLVRPRQTRVLPFEPGGRR
jgi:hypothetical protein